MGITETLAVFDVEEEIIDYTMDPTKGQNIFEYILPICRLKDDVVGGSYFS